MDVRLVIQKGSRKTRAVRLKAADTIIGRRQDCGLRIPSEAVSRQHCLLRIRDGCLTVEDLGSVNGTFLNGERVRGQCLVRPGDRLEVGPVAFLVQYALSPASANHLLDAGGEAPAGEFVPAVPVEDGFVPAVPIEDDAVPAIPLPDDDFNARIPVEEGDLLAPAPTAVVPEDEPPPAPHPLPSPPAREPPAPAARKTRAEPPKQPARKPARAALPDDDEWHLPLDQDIRDLFSGLDDT